MRAFSQGLLTLALLNATLQAQFIVNGSMTGTANVQTWNATPPPGWVDGGSSVDTLDATTSFSNYTLEPSANGGTFVHVAGLVASGSVSEYVSQTVSGLTPGETYTLSFEQSMTNTTSGGVDTHGYFAVSFGAQTQNSDLVALPLLHASAPWQPQSMQFTATSSTQVLTFAAKNLNGCCWLVARMVLDGVKLCVSSTCDTPQQALFTVTDTNELTKVDVDNGCSTTLIGVTQDSSSGPIRKLRGLEYVDVFDTMFGMTREGDLVRVDPQTGTTAVLLQLPFGNPGSEFWGGLAYDAGANALYTTNATDARELVAIDLNSFTATLIGSTVDSGGGSHQILGVGMYPASATPSGLPDPVPGVLYGISRLTQSLVSIDTNTALVSPVGGNVGIAKPQALSFDPVDGTSYNLEDFVSGGTAGLSTYDFNSFAPSLHCALPFGIAEPAGNPVFGWGGLSFGPDFPWSNQGCALPGLAGDPLLTGFGPLLATSANTITLSNAAPSALAARFIAFSSLPVPAFGGVLKANPYLNPLITTTSTSGSYAFAFVMPPGVPSGIELWVQWAIQDFGAINNVALSNALRGVTP